jgi:hypothetical protein
MATNIEQRWNAGVCLYRSEPRPTLSHRWYRESMQRASVQRKRGEQEPNPKAKHFGALLWEMLQRPTTSFQLRPSVSEMAAPAVFSFFSWIKELSSRYLIRVRLWISIRFSHKWKPVRHTHRHLPRCPCDATLVSSVYVSSYRSQRL